MFFEEEQDENFSVESPDKDEVALWDAVYSGDGVNTDPNNPTYLHVRAGLSNPETRKHIEMFRFLMEMSHITEEGTGSSWTFHQCCG
mmetsp:Transcript_5923/g.8374  ORF Transcript_5923/g.8374 Transcript_5923/m.8374 type:complete len:87 (+) Transcript_5923:252-512(+)